MATGIEQQLLPLLAGELLRASRPALLVEQGQLSLLAPDLGDVLILAVVGIVSARAVAVDARRQRVVQSAANQS